MGFSCGGPTNGHLHPSAPGGVPYSIYGTPLIASGEFGNSTGNFVALNGRIGLTSNTSSSDLEGSGFGNSRIGENNGGYDIRATPSHSGCFDSIKEDGSNTIPTQPDGASFGDIGKPSTSDVPSPHHSKTS